MSIDIPHTPLSRPQGVQSKLEGMGEVINNKELKRFYTSHQSYGPLDACWTEPASLPREEAISIGDRCTLVTWSYFFLLPWLNINKFHGINDQFGLHQG